MKGIRMRLLLFVSAIVCWESLNQHISELAQNLSDFTEREKIDKAIADDLWDKYMILHDNNLLDSYQTRHQFASNVYDIMVHNRDYYNGKHNFKLGVNRYSHFSYDQMNQILNGFHKSLKSDHKQNVKENYHIYDSQCGNCTLEIDWRMRNAVSDVKDQEACGSCYAFSATGALEGMYSIAHKKLVDLSEQQLVDCTFGWGNAGCNGGLMDNCFNYVHDIEGIQGEDTYPYEGQRSECAYNKTLIITSCDSIVNIEEGNEVALMDAVHNVGPISVAIDAGSPKFMLYKEGIYTDNSCSSQELNHGVLLVGYGVEKKDGQRLPYWLVKNSWSKSWGEKGYIKMARHNNMCGIASFASYPVINKH